MEKSANYFDVIVIGGGHAGCEAATAAARKGAKTAMINMDNKKLGTLSCNPAMGGVGKGHIIKEIDAFDGLMGRVTDQACIQFRMLNKSKGAAVWGPRAQCDRVLYMQAMQKVISSYENLTLIEDEATEIIVKNGEIQALRLASDNLLETKSLIVTTGTFLGGVIHRGEERIVAGRIGDKASNKLAQSLLEFDLPISRLKTGTPARIYKDSIDFLKCLEQKGDEEIIPFSYLHEEITIPQISCYITRTNKSTHEYINENILKSSLYNGSISSQGPRYCPSIEDKLKKFPDKEDHQIFLEPEGLDSNLIYPNGISTSLPSDVQDKFIRTINGLENCKIAEYGYAIEYYFVDPKVLRHDLMTKTIAGLFLAGQINGTTGYEEAGGQGLIAGMNAANYALAKELDILSRANSYIGVMIDDLVTKGVKEPYRIFTSRSENRLLLRQDNADERLTELGIKWGLVSATRKKMFHVKQDKIKKAKKYLQETTITPNKIAEFGVNIAKDGKKRSIFEIMGAYQLSYDKLCNIFPACSDIDKKIFNYIKNDSLYQSYRGQYSENELIENKYSLDLPRNIDYAKIGGLSNEIAQKLNEAKPDNIQKANMIEGMTPAALARIIIYRKLGKSQ